MSMREFLTVFVFCLLITTGNKALAVTEKGSAEATTGTTYILLVGIEDYEKLGPLYGPARDVCSLYQMYVGALGIAPDQVSVLLYPGRFKEGSPCFGVAAQPATRQRVLDHLRQVSGKLNSVDRLLIHFSGHGEEVNGEQVVLVADDALNVAKAVSVSELAAAIPSRSARRAEIAIFLDACRETVSSLSGRESDVSATAARISVRRAFKGFSKVAVFSSAGPGERSYIRPHSSEGHAVAPISYFTWTLVKGMLGFISDEKGYIRADQLAKYLEGAVPEMMKFEFGAIRVSQRPTATFLGAQSKGILLPTRARTADVNSFFFFAEVRAVAVDSEGKVVAGPSSFDIALPSNGKAINEYTALNPGVQNFPGPFYVPLPRAQPEASGVGWRYTTRLVFMFSRTRMEVVLCDASPNGPVGSASPQIVTAIDSSGRLVIDARRAFSRWRDVIADLVVEEDSEPLAPSHERTVNPGC